MKVGDLSGQVVGRGPAELRGDDDLGVPAAHPDEPDPPGRTASGVVAGS